MAWISKDGLRAMIKKSEEIGANFVYIEDMKESGFPLFTPVTIMFCKVPSHNELEKLGLGSDDEFTHASILDTVESETEI